MAMTKHTVMQAGRNELGDSIVFETVGADGKYIEWNLRDERTVILVKNADASSATLTVAKGDGINGPEDDLTLTVESGKTEAFTLDSSRYMQQGTQTAADKGRVKITASDSADVSIAAIALQ